MLEKKYTMGKGFERLFAIGYVVTVLTAVMFYFIYRDLYVNLGSTTILTGVILLTVILFYAEYKLFSYTKKHVFYVFEKDGLCLHGFFGKKTKYYWKDFEDVYMSKFAPYELCRVRFKYKNAEWKLIKYIGNPNGICLKIFDHIKDHVEIDSEIYKVTKALSD